MQHTVEAATTGRSKCRACGTVIAKGEMRFGERLPNPFGEEGTETTHFYHLRCGAYRRPESFAEVVHSHAEDLPERTELAKAVAFGLAHKRVQRINTVERASSGRARCRHCREAIQKATWRIGLVFFEEGMANPAGFIHVSCAAAYFETDAILGPLQHFGRDLGDDDMAELQTALTG